MAVVHGLARLWKCSPALAQVPGGGHDYSETFGNWMATASTEAELGDAEQANILARTDIGDEGRCRLACPRLVIGRAGGETWRPW